MANRVDRYDATTLHLRYRDDDAGSAKDPAAPQKARAVQVDVSFGRSAGDPVFASLTDSAGATHRFTFADQRQLRAFLNDRLAAAAIESDPARRALLEQWQRAVDLRAVESLGWLEGGQIYAAESNSAAQLQAGLAAPELGAPSGSRAASGMVARLQAHLVTKGLLPPTHAGRSNVDGRMGERTRAALWKFLTADTNAYQALFAGLPKGLQDKLPRPGSVEAARGSFGSVSLPMFAIDDLVAGLERPGAEVKTPQGAPPLKAKAAAVSETDVATLAPPTPDAAPHNTPALAAGGLDPSPAGVAASTRGLDARRSFENRAPSRQDHNPLWALTSYQSYNEPKARLRLDALAAGYQQLFPSSGLSQEQIACQIAATQYKLGFILQHSDPAAIQANLVAQFGRASDLEKVIIATTLASLMSDYNYDGAFYDGVVVDSSTAEMLAALRQSIRTGQKTPEGICSDIHLAVAQVLESLGIHSGAATVAGHVINIFRLDSGTVVINDYGTLYTGRSMEEVLRQYETYKGKVSLWYYLTDANGRIRGRVQTPLGEVLDNSVSPRKVMERFLNGETLPAGTRVDVVNDRGQLTGDAEAVGQFFGALKGRLAAGDKIVDGHQVAYTVAGLGFESEHLVVESSVGKYDVRFANGRTDSLVVGATHLGVKDSARVGDGKLSYGLQFRATGTVTTHQARNLNAGASVGGSSEARLGGRYEKPLAAEQGGFFVDGALVGLPATPVQDIDTGPRALQSGLSTLTFENHQLELASGVKLNLSEDQLLELRTRFTNTAIDQTLGVGATYGTDRGFVTGDVAAVEPKSWMSTKDLRGSVGVGKDLGDGVAVTASAVSDRLRGDAGMLAIQKTGTIQIPQDQTLPPGVKEALDAAGIDPAKVRLPREGLMRGVQYAALLALQRGESIPADVYAELGINVDLVDKTVVLPGWVSPTSYGHLNVAANARVSLDDFKKLDFGPLFAIDGEFGTWGFQVIQTMTRLRASAKIGTKNRLVVGVEVGVGLHQHGPVGLAAHVGWEGLKEDGRKKTVTVGTNLQLSIADGSIVFGDYNYGRSVGLAGLTTWSYRNPGDNVVDSKSGEVFAYKRARTAGGFLDLFQYVSKPEAQKQQIRRIVSRVGELADAGIGSFFSKKALGELADPEQLTRFAEFLSGDKVTKLLYDAKEAARAGTPFPCDALVVDELSADAKNDFRALEGDLHLASLDAELPPVTTPTDDHLDTAEALWRRKQETKLADGTPIRAGMRIIGEEKLDATEARGLEKLLAFVDSHVDPARFVNKQVTIREGSFFQSIGEALGLLSLQKDTQAGATISISRRLLAKLADVELKPADLTLPEDASDKEQERAAALFDLLAREDLLESNVSSFVFLRGAQFDARVPPPPEPEGGNHFPEEVIFSRKGGEILVNLDRLATAGKLERHLWRIKQEIGDSDVLDAVRKWKKQATQAERQTELARKSGQGQLHQYFPERPPVPVDQPFPGVRYQYRIYDAYGRPRFDRLYELTFAERDTSFSLCVIDRGERRELVIRSRAELAAALKDFPEVAPIIDGISGDAAHLPGLRVLSRLA
ncbi:MAG: hypothetical protein HY903_05145 [Deltaproteobacteria bacterium]|nr:hypothetical protein [Deltaproteobacteria bacterium]